MKLIPTLTLAIDGKLEQGKRRLLRGNLGALIPEMKAGLFIAKVRAVGGRLLLIGRGGTVTFRSFLKKEGIGHPGVYQGIRGDLSGLKRFVSRPMEIDAPFHASFFARRRRDTVGTLLAAKFRTFL